MKNKKVIFHKFEQGIYPRSVFISIGANIDSIKENFEFISDFDESYFSKNEKSDIAIGFSVVHKNTNYYGILMNFRSKKVMTISNIAHESVHIADYIFEEIGALAQDFSDKNEQYAYLVGWIADCINQVKTGKFKN